MRKLVVSLGEGHNAEVTKVSHCSFEEFCAGLLKRVSETDDKASNGWVSGAEFKPAYRHSDNFVARHLLSFDYDHIEPADVDDILLAFGSYSHLAYPTWSHTPEHPRIRVWLPLSRPCSYDEFQAVSRRVASWYSIEKMARESHVPAQYMFRPAHKPGQAEQFKALVEKQTALPWIDVDQVLASYENWTDRSVWPHRSEGDGVHNRDSVCSPLDKPGIVGDFCRSFTIEEAIERFDLPYKPGSVPGRLTYTAGSRPDGAIVYDDGTKLHSHHDTDPARGQTNAFDLVRLHRFGWLDDPADDGGITERSSFVEMARFAGQQPEVRCQQVLSEGFDDLDAIDTSWLDGGLPADAGATSPGVAAAEDAPRLAVVEKPVEPERIKKASSKCTDQENARRIQHRFGGQIISVGGGFYFWQGTHWAKDESSVARCLTYLSAMVDAEATKKLEELAKKRGWSEAQAAAAVEDPTTAPGIQPGDVYVLMESASLRKWSKQCGQKSTQDATKKLLRDLLVFDGKLLNVHKHLLPVRNGVVNLQTGELMAHDPKLYLTGCAPANYVASAEAPRFKQFLKEIYSEDQALIDFMQRWFGYCITGEVREHKMVLHVGPGGNGKGTLFDVLTHTLGEFSSTAAPNLLLSEGSMNRASNELADLVGRRMVTVSETDDSAQLREALVKQLTGGDRIKARFLFQEHFEFYPTHKLQMFTNYEPRIKGQDRGMWRRLLLVKYPIRYGTADDVADGKADRVGDLHLDEALRAEAPGILRWLVDGAQEWYKTGLRPPESVRRDTDTYRGTQDTVAQFVQERCKLEGRVALVGETEALYQAYKSWCAESGLLPLGRNRLSKEILRVVPTAKPARWTEGDGDMRRSVMGFEGLRLEAA